ncbi:MAG: DUF4363 family protein, partial [Clostridia bacterium]|nr:DUF4363 family protein [Clostridia bacterium]
GVQMNKRYIYVICIALVLLAVCVTEQIMINKFLGTMENKVASLIEFVGDREDINTNEIYEKVVDMEDTWNGYEGALCFFVNLKDIEDLGIELTKMKVYVVENNVVEFKASLALMLYYIDGYYNVMGISFENIF